MELLRISEKKLKVTLSNTDMEHYRLSNDTMDYDKTETRSAFWQILDEAKQRTGFDAGGEKIFVQIYPSRGGGCEMYITLVEAETSVTPSLPSSGDSLYCFSSLSLLLDVCRQLSELGYREKSTVLYYRSSYYLMICEHREGSLVSQKALGEYSFIEEYGTRLGAGIRARQLLEHGRCLEADRAVERFATL